jgi:hypothetical protein
VTQNDLNLVAPGDIPLQLVVQKHLFTRPNEPVGLEVQFEWRTGNTTIKVSEAGSPKVPTWDCSRPDLNLTMQVRHFPSCQRQPLQPNNGALFNTHLS